MNRFFKVEGGDSDDYSLDLSSGSDGRLHIALGDNHEYVGAYLDRATALAVATCIIDYLESLDAEADVG